MSSGVIERQQFVTWYTPDEKLPPKGMIHVVTISGSRRKNGFETIFDHAFALASWYDDGLGWELEDIDLDEFVVHAWCDLDPYGGEKANEKYKRAQE